MNKELKPSWTNSEMIAKGVLQAISEFLEVYFMTVLNRMMETASLMIPSPKTMLNNLGC